jgi:asparagine synthase (glutamine-hydrolysing)
VAPADLERARGVLSVYGRDGGGIWAGGSVALAACHAALGAPAADGGLFARDGRVVVADARIDNRAELLRELGSAECGRAALSDTELIWRCFEQWGEDCPRRLVGDYAFAVWDARTRRLFCARDYIGARPFFYFRAGEVFAFATDIRAVLAMPGVTARIDEDEVAQMFGWRRLAYFDAERTFFQNVHKLPFGNALACGPRDFRVTRYWRPEDIAPVVLPRIEDYAERLRELMREAVDARITGVGQAGVHVSGGLDSSVVAVLAARLRRSRGEAAPVGFSWSPEPRPGVADTEQPFIEQVQAQEGLVVHYSPESGEHAPRILDVAIAAHAWDAAFVENHLQPAVAGAGVELMLSGWGGDQGASFAGEGLPVWLFRRGRWGEIVRTLSPHPEQPREWVRAARRWWHEAVRPRFDRGRDEAPRAVAARPAYVRPELMALADDGGRDDRRLAPATDPRRRQWDYYYAGICTARLESWALWGAEWGVAYGYPLLDRRVMEFALGVPVELFWRGGTGRWLFRRAAAPLLPAGMADQRSKRETGFVRRTEALVAELVAAIQLRLRTEAHWRQNPWIDVEQFLALSGAGPKRVTTAETLRVWTALQIWRHWGEQTLDSPPKKVIVPS